MSDGQVGVVYTIYGEVAREELGVNATKVVWVDPSKVDADWLQRMRDAGRVVESESAPEAHRASIATDLPSSDCPVCGSPSEPHCGPVAEDLPLSDCPVCGSPETGYKALHEPLTPSCTVVEHINWRV